MYNHGGVVQFLVNHVSSLLYFVCTLLIPYWNLLLILLNFTCILYMLPCPLIGSVAVVATVAKYHLFCMFLPLLALSCLHLGHLRLYLYLLVAKLYLH